jgi:integrase/recombinase XerD
MFLYNTGARVQEAADLRCSDIDLEEPCRVRLHGKGDKWRCCPIWPETAQLLKQLIADREPGKITSVFTSQQRKPLTRFGIYKIVKRHTARLQCSALGQTHGGLFPHAFRHSSAVHLLEAGVEVNVIRAWLGHVSLDTTNRYAEITLRTKQAAVTACLPPVDSSAEYRPAAGWRQNPDLLKWLDSL